MKKVLLLSAGFVSLGVTAQTITAADTLYAPLSTTYYVMDSNAVNLDAVTGTGVTWNYTTLYGEIGVTTNDDDIIDASTAPESGTFTSSDYNSNLATFASYYFTNSPTETSVQGYVFSVDAYDVLIHFDSDELKFMQYPMTVGNTYNDLTDGVVDVNGGTATGTATGDVDVTVDGFGTLNVGADSHPNVIRVKFVENLSTSITIVPFPPDNGTVTRTIYYYYDLANSKQAIFMHADITIASTLINDSFNAVYYSSLPSYAELAEENNGQFSVYPNPSNDVVTINTDGSADRLTVFNLNGQVITSFINPQAQETISVSELPSGTYLIQVLNDGVVTEEKLVVE